MVQALMATIVALGATPAMPTPLTRPAIVRGHVGAVALQVLHRGLVAAVAVGDLPRVGRRRVDEDERARPGDVDAAGKVGVGEVDAAVDHADARRRRRWRWRTTPRRRRSRACPTDRQTAAPVRRRRRRTPRSWPKPARGQGAGCRRRAEVIGPSISVMSPTSTESFLTSIPSLYAGLGDLSPMTGLVHRPSRCIAGSVCQVSDVRVIPAATPFGFDLVAG